METKTATDLIDLLLNSGGDVATVVIVYLAFKLKEAVHAYLKGVNAMLSSLKETVESNAKANAALHDDVRKLRTEINEILLTRHARATLGSLGSPLNAGTGEGNDT